MHWIDAARVSKTGAAIREHKDGRYVVRYDNGRYKIERDKSRDLRKRNPTETIQPEFVDIGSSGSYYAEGFDDWRPME